VAWIRTVDIESRKRGPQKRYRVCWRDAGDTKVRTKTFVRMEDARRHKTKVERDLQTGTYVDPKHGSITLADFFELYLDRESAALRPSTRALYRQLSAHFRHAREATAEQDHPFGHRGPTRRHATSRVSARRRAPRRAVCSSPSSTTRSVRSASA
jgi:hypothetical protein